MKRIKNRRDFNRVYRKGRSIQGRHMYFKFVENALAYPRFKVVVSKKISKSAVVRNRNRRRAEEIMALNYPKITKKVDGIFFLLKNTNEMTSRDLKDEVEGFLKKAGLWASQ